MARIGLNPNELQSLPDGEHCDGAGLYLRVTGMGGRSWIVKYQWAKKQEKMGIGSFADVSLKDARKKAKTIRDQARDGINPKLHREQVSASARSAPLFKDFATMICDRVVGGLKGEKSKAKWRRCFDVYSKPLHSLPINQIGVDDSSTCCCRSGARNQWQRAKRGRTFSTSSVPPRPWATSTATDQPGHLG